MLSDAGVLPGRHFEASVQQQHEVEEEELCDAGTPLATSVKKLREHELGNKLAAGQRSKRTPARILKRRGYHSSREGTPSVADEGYEVVVAYASSKGRNDRTVDRQRERIGRIDR